MTTLLKEILSNGQGVELSVCEDKFHVFHFRQNSVYSHDHFDKNSSGMQDALNLYEACLAESLAVLSEAA